MEQTTTITLPMSKTDIQYSATTVLQHLMTCPPNEQDIDYNTGVEILFDVLRNTFAKQDNANG